MGPRNRPASGSPKHHRLQDLSHHAVRKGSTERIRQGAIGQGIYPTVKVPLLFTIFLHKKERRETPTGPRLSTTKLPHHQKPISTAAHSRTNQSNTARSNIHQIGYTMGIQQRPYQRRRRMEGSL